MFSLASPSTAYSVPPHLKDFGRSKSDYTYSPLRTPQPSSQDKTPRSIMDNRYRYNRPRSPTLYNPARASLPVNLAYAEHQAQHHHLHAIPVTNIRREVIPISVSQPRSGNDRINTAGPVTTTTYKIKAEPSRGSSVREGSRTRRSTVGSQDIPTVITTIAPPPRQHRPVVHGSSNGRSSPVGNPYRSSGEDQYYSVPASSNKHRHHHTHRYSATMDNADMNRLARESGRLQVERGREQPVYDSRTSSSSRPTSMYTTTSIIRQPETITAGYGDDGYGYTNPKDLVEYDLKTDGRRHQHSRRDSYDGNRISRPSSVNGYNQVARPYDSRDVRDTTRDRDTRERGPPPSTRGFAQVNARTWPQEQPVQQNARMSMPVPPVMDPIQRPHSARPVASVQRPERVEPPFDGPLLGDPQLQRRSSSRRPVSVYQDRERRSEQRDDGREYYDPRDDDLRRDRKHQKSRDDLADQRAFSRPERSDRDDRGSSDYPRSDRQDRADRVERREERSERREERRPDLKEYSSGRDALAAGLSTAAAALGIGAIAKKASRDDKREEREKEDRLEREEQRRRDERDREDRDREEARRRRDREEREAEEAEERAKERRREEKAREERAREERAREEERKRDEPPMITMKPKEPDAATFLGLNGRDTTERQSVPVARPVSRGPVTRDERSDEPERRRRPEPVVTTNLSAPTEGRGDSPPSDGQRTPRRRRPSAAATFNPRDALDLRALKEELAAKESSPPIPPKEPLDPVQSNPIPGSFPAETKTELRDDRGRLGPLAPAANAAPERQPERQLRVVSPPREKEADKPVKGILRQPREKFPEDPSPIREGVAPLKDAKKDGVPPDARWTKINRKLVNPEALEAGKERYEARDDFVIVLRVLSKEEVQAYAIATQQIREGREAAEDREEREASDRRRRARRERHERHKRDRESGVRGESTHRSRRHARHQDGGSDSQSDETTDEEQRPKMLEHTPRHAPSMSGGLGDPYGKEPSVAANSSSRRRDD